jgi:hypothetical protein
MTSVLVDLALFLSRWVELSALSKATILLVLGLTAARLARRSRASVRHLVWASTFVALVALPVIITTAPKLRITLSAPSNRASIPTTTQATPAPGRPSPFFDNAGWHPVGDTSRVTSWPGILIVDPKGRGS